jgi:hypothetical protein
MAPPARAMVFQKVKIPDEFCTVPCKISAKREEHDPARCRARAAKRPVVVRERKQTDRVWIT